MSACEYRKPYSEASADNRDRFGTGFAAAADETAPCMSVESDGHGPMAEYGIAEIKHCPFRGRELEDK
jgi:hypothetical protein